MTNCSPELLRTVPLLKVVSAAVIDSYEDIGKAQHQYSHWAVRGLKKLERQSLKTTFRHAILTVNRTTNTATLPLDCEEVIQAYVIDHRGKKVALRRSTDLVDEKNMNEIECEDKCEKCNQDKTICNDLTVTEEVVLVTINDSIYEQTIIKKLYPDGSYYLETNIPVFDVESESVIYTKTKEYITSLDLKPCGCIDDTPENIEKIRCCNYDVYCCHYASCDRSCTVDYGGYRVFPETGLIQFDKIGRFTKVYIEYWGFLVKKNGQYHVPSVAFETLVNWVKFKKVENKTNIPLGERQWTLEQYKREYKNMKKIMGRISVAQLLWSIGLTPKFDINIIEDDYCLTTSVSSSDSESSSSDSSSNDNNVPACPSAVCPPNSATFVPFDIAEIAGIGAGPTPGTNTYQNDKLKNALGVNMIIVNNTNETIKGQQFSIDTVTGTITRYQGDNVTPNNWFEGDVLVVPTFFKSI